MSSEPPQIDEETVRLPVEQHNGAIVEAVRRLDEAGVDVEDLGVRRPTLDDVFLALTGHGARRRAGCVRRARGGGGMTHLVGDSLVMAERNLVRLPARPTC